MESKGLSFSIDGEVEMKDDLFSLLSKEPYKVQVFVRDKGELISLGHFNQKEEYTAKRCPRKTKKRLKRMYGDKWKDHFTTVTMTFESIK